MVPAARIPKRKPKYEKKAEDGLMKFLAWLMKPFNDSFLSGYWTTINRTVFVPARAVSKNYLTPDWFKTYHRILGHEGTHVAQAEAYTFPLYAALYLGPSLFLLPVSIVLWILCIWFTLWIPATVVSGLTVLLAPLTGGLAWWRWYFEREAYLPEVIHKYRRAGRKYAQRRIDRVINNLATDYFFTWPKGWMQNWFDKQLAKADEDPNFDGVKGKAA